MALPCDRLNRPVDPLEFAGRLSQETRKPTVLERPATSLALRTVVDRVLLEVDLRDRRPADVARLAELLVYAVRARVARASLSQLEAALQLVVHRLRKSPDLLRADVSRQRIRRQLCGMEDLVRPRAADARDHALVAEQRVQPARLARQDLAELCGADLVRFRPEVAQLQLDRVGSEQPDSCALLLAGLGED